MLVNIFGGIVRCDLIAEGIVAAVRRSESVPVVVRLEGTKAAEGRRLLDESGLALQTAADLTEAAEKVVAARRDLSYTQVGHCRLMDRPDNAMNTSL